MADTIGLGDLIWGGSSDTPPPPPPPQKPPSTWDSFKTNILEPAVHGLSTIGEGALHALPDTIGFAGDVAQDVANLGKVAINPTQGLAPLKNIVMPGTGPSSKAADQSFTKAELDYIAHKGGKPEDVMPQNKTEEYLNAGSRGAADLTLMGGPEGAGRLAAAGVSGAVSGKAVYDLTGNETAATVAGLLGAGIPEAARFGIHRVELGRSILRGSKDPEFPDLVNTVLGLEGGGTLDHPNVSPKGAEGPMQVMGATARDPGYGIKPWDGKTQADLVRVGTQYLAKLNDMFGGDKAKVLAAYNAGPGHVQHLIKTYGDDWHEHLPTETKGYLANGLAKMGKSPAQVEEPTASAIPQTPLSNDEEPMSLTEYANSIGHPVYEGAEEPEDETNAWNPAQYPHVNDMMLDPMVREALPPELKGTFDKIDQEHMNELSPDELQNLEIHLKNNPDLVSQYDDHDPFTIQDKGPKPGTPEFDEKYGYAEPKDKPNFSYKTHQMFEDFAKELDISPDELKQAYIDQYDSHLGDITHNLADDFKKFKKESAALDAKYKTTPEEDHDFYGDDDLAIDEDDGFPEYPAPHYEYFGKTPYDKFYDDHGVTLSPAVKWALSDIAKQKGVHEYDIAEAHLSQDPSTGHDPEAITKQVQKLVKQYNKLSNALSDVEPGEYSNVGSTPQFGSKPNKYPSTFSAKYDPDKKHYLNIKDYEEQTGKKIGPLTRQAIEQYAEDNGLHKDSVASHALSETGDQTIKDGVNLWRDNLAKEQMTKKEYAAYQKLPTTNPKVLKILDKYLSAPKPETTKAPSAIARAGRNFLNMMKDNHGGTAPTPEELHYMISEWNKGTHYLMKGPDGSPLRIYHGTRINYEGMPSGDKNRMPYGYVLYSTDPDFASQYAKFYPDDVHREWAGEKASRVFPAYVKADEAIADFRKPEDLDKAVKWYQRKDNARWGIEHDLARGSWDMWENPDMLKANGWKGAFLTEGMGDDKGLRLNIMLEDHLVKSVFDPETYRNKTLGHKIVNTLTAMMKDESGALDTDKIGKDVKKAVKGRNKQDNRFAEDDNGPFAGMDPADKLTAAIREVAPLTDEQKKLYHEIKSTQAAKLAALQKEGGTIENFHQQMANLDGKMPELGLDSISKNFTKDDVHALLQRIVDNKALSPFDKIDAQRGLMDMLGEHSTAIPAPKELSLLQHVFGTDLVDAIHSKSSFGSKLGRGLEQVLGIPRSFKTIGDIGAIFRQTAPLIGSREWFSAVSHTWKNITSQKQFNAAMQHIYEDPNYHQMKRAGVQFTDMGHVLSDREEVFRSNLAEHIPGIGAWVRGSERGFTGVLNEVRAGSFNRLYDRAIKWGVDMKDPKNLKELGEFVNVLTGRGSFGKLTENAMPFLSKGFFAPRLYASRFKLLNPVYFAKLPGYLKAEYGWSLLRYTAYMAGVVELSKSLGAKVEDDLRSNDFGRIIMKDTHFDFSGSIQGYVRLAAQVLTGQKKTQSGKIENTGPSFIPGERKMFPGQDQGKYKPTTTWDTLLQFGENKAAPVPAFLMQALRGHDFGGEANDYTKHGWTSFQKNPILNMFVPMSLESTLNALDDYGTKSSLPLGVGAGEMVGISGSTYKTKISKKDTEANQAGNFQSPQLQSGQVGTNVGDVKW